MKHHIIKTPDDCDCKSSPEYEPYYNCPTCDGGLAVCMVCGKVESELSEPCEWPTVKFLNHDCILEFGWYSNGRLAIKLVIAETGEPMATATVNIPEANLKPGCVFIKDYSENQGMIEALDKAGFIELTGGVVNTGFVKADEVKLTDKLKDYPGFPDDFE